jgi:L-seryl-tRNA(Ser) seleniumtransferase
MPERGQIYRDLGVEPVINATATVTVLGGSLMRPQTLDAMRQAAECFVDLNELGTAVGRRLAQLTHNEAAFVCGGAAASMFLATAACMARGVPDGVLRFVDLPDLPDEVVIHRAHRIPYDQAFELARARLVEVGLPVGTTEDELERAISERTAMVFYLAGGGRQMGPGALPLATVLRIAKARGVPVVVDAAAQIPPVDSLWSYAQAGADLVLFSGGKGLRGPASTGIIFGRPDLVERCRANSAPLQRLGRSMKVGKEDLVGILSAVELTLAEDASATDRFHEAVVAFFVDWGAGRTDVTVAREFPSEAGQPMPRARITFGGRVAARRDAVMADLLGGRPRIAVWPAGDDGIYVNPQTMLPGEEQAIARRLEEILGSPGPDRVPEAGT